MLQIEIKSNKYHMGFMAATRPRYKYTCPDCQTVHRFLTTSPYRCKNCEKLLADLSSLIENEFHRKGWHFGGE